MKYVILEDNEIEEDELLYDIADFFWNNGNEVLIRDKNNHHDIPKNNYCVVLLIYEDCCEKYLFKRALEKIYEDFGFENNYSKRTILIFSKNGVFINIIPFPHKIFHFEKLCKYELTGFFHWCSQLNLFIKP